MSGHSKWASIKHKKAIVDSRRGKLFTKLARAITTAARDGGGELEGNPALQLAVQKAKDASMPKDNIERAIAKGTGAGADAAAIEDVMYEAYAPGGVAMLIEAMTENRNRTGADVRHLLAKHGGSLGEPGSVAYLFDKRGLIVIDGEQLLRGRPHARHRGRRRGHRRGGRGLRGPDRAGAAHRRPRGARRRPASRSSPPSSPGCRRRACRSRRTTPRSSCASSTRSRTTTTSTRCTRTSTSTPTSSNAPPPGCSR